MLNALPTLYLDKRQINLSQVSDSSDLTPYPPFAQRALQFCQQWLNGQQEFVVYTSGSTGAPKATLLYRRQMEASAAMTAEALHLQKGYKALVCLNTDYIAGIMMLVRCLETGMDIYLQAPSTNPLDNHSPGSSFDFTALVPMQIQHILSNDRSKKTILDNMKAILLGGAPISNTLEDMLQSVDAPCYHTYGMTETVSHIALRRINGPHKSNAFTAFPEVQLGTDARGCLTIQSILSNGEKLVTNDLVRLLNSHSFMWLGRADQVINSGGVKLQVTTIESKLEPLFNKLAPETPYFVASLPHPILGNAAVLCIESKKFVHALQQAVDSNISTYLQRYEVPKAIFWIDSFEHTPSGKIDRLATLQPYQNHFNTASKS